MSDVAPALSPRLLEIPREEWTAVVGRFTGPDVRRALWQVINTLGPLTATFFLMYQLLDPAPWATALLVPVAAGLLVRTFIIMHDCAHGSFLPWPRLNDALGFITGVLTVTPFTQWRRDHALHHASSGDLDRRGHGDVPTLTVAEYRALSPGKQRHYRFVRHPLTLLLLGPLHLMINQRIRGKSKATKTKQVISVWATNAAIAAAVALAIWAWGAKAVLLVYLPAMYVAASVGIWLFYVQHQFEDAYWEEHGEWDYATAAITGSSHLRLHPVLGWFTGNIGLHHVHHIGPRIPNYRLQQAHDSHPVFNEAPVLTIGMGMRTLRLALFDEETKRLVPFSAVR